MSAGSLTSCSDFLKEEPYSYVGIDEVGNDNEAVGLWVTGVYSKWLDDMARWGNSLASWIWTVIMHRDQTGLSQI